MTIEENRARLLANALSGGPGLRAYVFNAEVLCIRCGRFLIRAIVAKFPVSMLTEQAELPCSSDEFPQPAFFPESDTRQYCADCGEYLYGG